MAQLGEGGNSCPGTSDLKGARRGLLLRRHCPARSHPPRKWADALGQVCSLTVEAFHAAPLFLCQPLLREEGAARSTVLPTPRSDLSVPKAAKEGGLLLAAGEAGRHKSREGVGGQTGGPSPHEQLGGSQGRAEPAQFPPAIHRSLLCP